MADFIRQEAGQVRMRVFSDSAPVLDRAWARKSGLGWIGKNTCLIHPKFGSFFFIGEIITELELAYDNTKVNDLCGGCNRCIEHCPTGAITAPRVLDANKCISYHTIENKGQLPDEIRDKFGDWIFGCDICQDVCPWNRMSKPHIEESFMASGDLLNMHKKNWEELSEDKFDLLFRDSALSRAGYNGLKRNIAFVKGND